MMPCNAASEAFDEWKNISGKERKKLLHKIADGIEDRAREIALVESYDSGCLLYTSPSPRDRSLSRMPSSA